MSDPAQIALDTAKGRHDFSVFWDAANKIHAVPPCTANGINGGTWYTLQGGCKFFDVCVACHAGIVEPLGLSSLFELKSKGNSQDILCDFCPAQPRYGQFMLKLIQTVLVGVFEPFESYVRRFAGVPICQRSSFLTNGVWYGYADAAFCTDCYDDVVAGSL